MATNSMDFTNGLQRPSGSKAKSANYTCNLAHPYALQAINVAMGSKCENAENLYDAVSGANPKAFGNSFSSGASAHKEATQTQTINPVLTQKIANDLAKS